MSVWFDPILAVAPVRSTSCPERTHTVVTPLTDPSWDQRIAQFQQATIFHTRGWARILSQTYGFQPVYLVEKQRDQWTQVLPLMEVRSLLGSRRGVSLPFSDSCPLLSVDPQPCGLNCPPFPFPLPESLGAPLKQLSVSRGWTQLELRPGLPLAPEAPASTRFFSHEVPLVESAQEQLNRCVPATRRSLRKAQESGLTVTVGWSEHDLDTYFALHCLTRRRQGSPPQPMQFFKHLYQEFLAEGTGFVVLAWHGGKAAAGAVFLRFGTRATYKFGASDPAYQSSRPNQLVMWNGLRHAISRGCTQMDLGRTSLHNEGLRRFKEGWGAREEIQGCYRTDLRTGNLLPAPDRTQGWQTTLFRHVPTPVSRWIGRLIYRFAA